MKEDVKLELFKMAYEITAKRSTLMEWYFEDLEKNLNSIVDLYNKTKITK